MWNVEKIWSFYLNDKLEILSYAIPLVCSIGADVKQMTGRSFLRRGHTRFIKTGGTTYVSACSVTRIRKLKKRKSCTRVWTGLVISTGAMTPAPMVAMPATRRAVTPHDGTGSVRSDFIAFNRLWMRVYCSFVRLACCVASSRMA